MSRPRAAFRRRRGGQQPLGELRDPVGEADEHDREHHVECEMEQHDLVRGRHVGPLDQQSGEVHERDRDGDADQLEQEIAERHAARLGLGLQCREHGQQSAAEIRPEHQPDATGTR